MSGFQANTGEMMASATAVQGIASDIDEFKTTVTTSAVSARDFGRAHEQGGSRYVAGLTKIAEITTAHATAMRGLSDKLRASATGYDWSDSSGRATVKSSGGN
ncbi:type VII secretion target [Umezawaea beigongshangensis]|uniref:type VII secretion target n=1 Tax=Umezawaea beigongshangensis TaxID=2780383 RepID=UPI0018F2312C|nr:type VII secretion target [Umezawaea beigongshangensis]